MSVERPLDLLNELKGQIAKIKLKNNPKPIKAQVIAFDIHINLVVIQDGKRQFIRGDIVEGVEECL